MPLLSITQCNVNNEMKERCTNSVAYILNGGDDMASVKKKEKAHYTCTVTYTEGYQQRLTEALVDIYYNRQKGIYQEQNSWEHSEL